MPYILGLDVYTELKREAFLDVFSQPERYQKLHLEATLHLLDSKCMDCLEDEVYQGDPEPVIDIALRYASGCRAKRSLNQATDAIDMLVVPKKRVPFTVVPSDELYRRALSLSALVYFLKYRHGGQETGTVRAYHNSADLYRAVLDANAVVERGLHCESVFNIAEYVLKLGQDLHQDVRGDARFGRFAALWAAYDEYKRATEKREEQPSRYRCATPFCGFEALKGRQLRQCAGACPPELKPSYCSRECQKKDWARHKVVCTKPRKPAEAH